MEVSVRKYKTIYRFCNGYFVAIKCGCDTTRFANREALRGYIPKAIAAVSGGKVPAKNITEVCNVNQVCKTANYFSYNNGPIDSSNDQPVYKSVSSMENNPDFSKAKLIFESTHY